MNRIYLTVLIALLSFDASTSEPDQYLCITEDATGFNWKNNKWVQVNFVESKYILKRPDPESIFYNKSSAWVLVRFGDKDEFPLSSCGEDFNSGGYLHCSARVQFKLNRQNLYFGLSSITGALNTEKSPDCHKEVKPIWPDPRCSNPDSMVLEYGKCSPF